MKVSYNALEVKQIEQKNKDVFVKKLGGRIRDARVEMRVCPVCGSENVEICARVDDYSGVLWGKYYLDGHCRNCDSDFQSDDLFCRAYVAYDKDHEKYHITNREICDIKKSMRGFALETIICIVLLGVSLVCIAKNTGELSMAAVIAVVSIIFGVLFACFWWAERRELEEVIEIEKSFKKTKEQLEKENIPIFIRGFSVEDDCVLDYLNAVPDWSDVKE